MKRFSVAALLLLLVAAPLPAETVEGYLLDKQCSATAEKGAEALKAHTKDCALSCKDGGFGVVTADGKFLKFDAEGDSMAEKFLGVISRTDDLKVSVTGDVSGDTISVKAIQLS